MSNYCIVDGKQCVSKFCCKECKLYYDYMSSNNQIIEPEYHDMVDELEIEEDNYYNEDVEYEEEFINNAQSPSMDHNNYSTSSSSVSTCASSLQTPVNDMVKFDSLFTEKNDVSCNNFNLVLPQNSYRLWVNQHL